MPDFNIQYRILDQVGEEFDPSFFHKEAHLRMTGDIWFNPTTNELLIDLVYPHWEPR